MKFSAVLLAAHTASVVGTQPDGSALLQLRKLSVLSANNANSSRVIPAYVAPCDKDDLAKQIVDLDSTRDSQSKTLVGKISELKNREGLVKSEQSKIEGLQEVLIDKQTTLQERETAVTEIQDKIASTSANLTSYKDKLSVKTKELTAAQEAVTAARATEKNMKKAGLMAYFDYLKKAKLAAEQVSLVETTKTVVEEAKAAFETGQKTANAACTAAADFRAKATAAKSAHEAAVAQLEKATAEHEAAVTARDQRRSEKSTAQQNLDAAKAKKASAASRRTKECGEKDDAETKEESAEGKYRAKKKACDALAEEAQHLDQQQAAAQVAYDVASREAASATAAHGKAKCALNTAQAKKDAASQALSDAQGEQTSAVAKETSECAKAEAAQVVVTETTSELHQARESYNNARFADFQATSALTRATSQESTACDAASKAQCAMNRAKASLDASKLRYDEAVAKRKGQDEVVAAAATAADSAKQNVVKAESTVDTAKLKYKETGKTKATADAAQRSAYKLYMDAKKKHADAVRAQGSAKADLDTATERMNCASNRYTKASNDFKTANADKEEKEDAKRICDEDLKAKKNPERAVELLERLQVAYDGVEMALGVWKETKGKMESIKQELDMKTKKKQSKEAEYKSKVAYTAKAKTSREQLREEYKKAKAAFEAACAAHSAAYEHLVSSQNQLEVFIESYNEAVDVHSNAVQLQQDFLAAENLAKREYDFALDYWNKKVADHDRKKGQCAEAGTAKEAAEAEKEKTASAYASAAALVESLQARLECVTRTWETAKSHCRAARDDRAEMDAAVVLAEKALSDAEAALSSAQTAAAAAAAEEKAALDKRRDAKAALEAAIKAATQKTKETMECENQEEKLRLAWVSADAELEKEQKQCSAACTALTAAHGAVVAAQTAYDTAATNHENACALASSAEATKIAAAAAEGAAEASSNAADCLAGRKEHTCAKLTTDAETLKSELDSAKADLKTQSDVLTQKQADSQAASAALKKAQAASTKAVQAVGVAEGAVIVAQDALDDVEECIDALEKTLAGFEADLKKAGGYVADSKALVAKEEEKIAAAQVVLTSYQTDVTRLKQEVQSAQAALDATVKALTDAEATLEACPATRCDPPAMPDHWDETPFPNLVDGATWLPACTPGYKVDYCDDDSNCGDEAESMTCTDGKLTPSSFRCAPILTGSLRVHIKEGRTLSFGEEKLNREEFEFHPIPSDPYVLVDVCGQTQQTSTKKNSYDAVWDHEPSLDFRIDEAGCSAFRIAVKDDRADDKQIAKCQATAMQYIGAVEKLEVTAMCDDAEKTEKNCVDTARESFKAHPNQQNHRRIIIEGGGVLDFWFEWTPDLTGPIKY